MLRGSVSVGGAALTTLCIVGVLWLAATHFRPNNPTVAETIAIKNACIPSRCGTKVSAEH